MVCTLIDLKAADDGVYIRIKVNKTMCTSLYIFTFNILCVPPSPPLQTPGKVVVLNAAQTSKAIMWYTYVAIQWTIQNSEYNNQFTEHNKS